MARIGVNVTSMFIFLIVVAIITKLSANKTLETALLAEATKIHLSPLNLDVKWSLDGLTSTAPLVDVSLCCLPIILHVAAM